MPLSYTDLDLVTATKEGATVTPFEVPTAKVHKAATAGAGNGEGLFTADLGYQVRNKRGRLAFHLNNPDPTYDCYVRFISDYSAEGLALEPRDVVVPAGGAIFVGPFSALFENNNKEDSGADGTTYTDYIFIQFSTDNSNNATTGYAGSGNDYPLQIVPLYIPQAVSV